MSDLLLEILSEEIPARMQKDASANLAEAVSKSIEAKFQTSCDVHHWSTPMRIGLHIRNIPSKIKATSETLRGPKISAPKQALDGFLKKNSLTEADLTVENDYYFATIINKGGSASDSLKELIETELNKFVWPKSMRWGTTPQRWVRPIKSILCKYGSEILDFEFANIKASNFTYGHRFLAPQKLRISDYEDYKSQLKNSSVILEREDRKKLILNQIEDLIKDLDANLILDNVLLDEITGLIEHPKVMLGKIDQEFLSLPREVLIITLKHHQKYLMLEDSKKNISPYFIIVSNINPKDGGTEVIRGNERVLRARLSDAKFFFEQDKKLSLESRVDYLKKLTFHEKLGSVHSKMTQTLNYAEFVGKYFKVSEDDLRKCIKLSKSDLVTNMVKEFPELQGIMGYYYAQHDKESEDVAIAIKEHYKPQGPNDSIPRATLAKAIAVCDKLDTLNQMFSINIRPTGSKDPFALRRAANGVIRIVGENNISEFLEKLSAANLLRGDVRDFILERKLK